MRECFFNKRVLQKKKKNENGKKKLNNTKQTACFESHGSKLKLAVLFGNLANNFSIAGTLYTYTANGKIRFRLKISQIRKATDKNIFCLK